MDLKDISYLGESKGPTCQEDSISHLRTYSTVEASPHYVSSFILPRGSVQATAPLETRLRKPRR